MGSAIRTIVAGVADLDPSDPVLQYAEELAERSGVVAYLVHAYTPVAPVMEPGVGFDLALVPTPIALPLGDRTDLERELLARIQDRQRSLPPGARLVPRVEDGPAHTALARVAEEVGADLLLVGATHRGRAGRALLGTTADRTMREARAPTLVLRPPLPAGGARVLLTTDLSEPSAVACARGIAIAQELFGAGPVTFRCLYTAVAMPGDVPPLHEEQAEADALGELRRFLERVPTPGATVEPLVRIGSPADEINAHAAAWPADLVVLATHGRSGIARMLLGSVAETVSRQLPCSALLVPFAASSP